ncbi:MAG: flagellar export chaperone FliS [Betaproteobacteria bacterium]|nr:flagellar export chaperone FliS [Betaproteobacteria bacterium]
MNAMANNALNAYTKVGVDANVLTASPHKLILMLFDGAIKAISLAKFSMNKKEIGPKGEAISKAIAIIDEGLKLSLDVKAGGELAENLSALYEYMCHRLLVANLKNDIGALEEVSRLLMELRDAWAAIEKPQGVTGIAKPATIPEKLDSVTSFGRV